MFKVDYFSQQVVECIEQDPNVRLAYKGQNGQVKAMNVEAEQVASLEQKWRHKDSNHRCFQSHRRYILDNATDLHECPQEYRDEDEDAYYDSVELGEDCSGLFLFSK